MQIAVNFEALKATAWLTDLQKKQVPFATAKALTQTAQDIQKMVQAEMPNRFTLRNDWVRQGIRIIPATKSNLRAVVFSRDAFMSLQEEGGDKRPKKDRNLAIPLAARRTKKGLINKADLPENLGRAEFTVGRGGKQVARRGREGVAFKFKAQDGREYLALRRGNKLELMYLLTPQARVKKALGLRETGRRMYAKAFNNRFGAALKSALDSAR